MKARVIIMIDLFKIIVIFILIQNSIGQLNIALLIKARVIIMIDLFKMDLCSMKEFPWFHELLQ